MDVRLEKKPRMLLRYEDVDELELADHVVASDDCEEPDRRSMIYGPAYQSNSELRDSRDIDLPRAHTRLMQHLNV